MTRLILLVAIALFSSLAHAVPACLPSLYGPQFPGAKLVPLVRGNAGWYAYGWCRAADGSPAPVYLLCAHGECSSDLGTQVGRTLSALGLQLIGSDPAAVYGGWWDANPRAYDCGPNGPQRTALGTPRAAACVELLALMERDRPAWTPPAPVPTAAPAYVVKYNPSSSGTPNTRPAYGYSNGVRANLALPNTIRATAGQPCDPAKAKAPGTSGTEVYAAYGPDFAADRVTLCVKP
jgi:hypothetical protein